MCLTENMKQIVIIRELVDHRGSPLNSLRPPISNHMEPLNSSGPNVYPTRSETG